MSKFFRGVSATLILGLTFLLTGCKYAILDPKGMIAASEKHLFIEAVGLMLIVVIPVIIMSFVFAYKYRAKNTTAKYTPSWSHSNKIEAVCWLIPCVIIGILAYMTWVSSHQLDPYRPLAVKKKPLLIEAIALNWKWLFVYPKQNIATVNFMEIPVNQPVRFYVTSDAPMNSIEIPQLAGQIYAMTGMRTKLNFMANTPGDYKGMSTNFSGAGFAGMKFIVRVASEKKYHAWLAKVRTSPKHLTGSAYLQLRKNSENNPVAYYSQVVPKLFGEVVMKYMKPGVHFAKMPSSKAVSKQLASHNHHEGK